MIEVCDLVKRYGSRTAVDQLSFKVEKGQIFGFLGPNGAGKSTTMNIMTGYLGPTSGEVIVAGHSMITEPEEAKRHIGYLPEQPPLYVGMTVEEYLYFAASLKKVHRCERAEQLDQVMEMTMLSDVRERLIRNLSKGYRQRVGLAQALLGFPEILILDEPTVGLDPKQILEIRTLIRTLSQEHTVILSSHILSEVQETCDHILIIHRGKMVAAGAPAELERNFAGSRALLVAIKGPVGQVEELLQKLPWVTSIQPANCEDSGTASFRVEQAENADVREDLFRACAHAELPLLMLQQDKMTLEHIFLKLTSDTGDALTEAEALDMEDQPEKDGEEENNV